MLPQRIPDRREAGGEQALLASIDAGTTCAAGLAACKVSQNGYNSTISSSQWKCLMANNYRLVRGMSIIATPGLWVKARQRRQANEPAKRLLTGKGNLELRIYDAPTGTVPPWTEM